MQITVHRDQIVDFGTYEEAGVLTVGFKVTGAPFETLILQIDTRDSELREERQGPYVELDDRKAFYGAVTRLDCRADGVLELGLDPAMSGGVEAIGIELPVSAADDAERVRRFVETYATYPELRPRGERARRG